VHLFPKQGDRAPWQSPVIYDEDVREMKHMPVANRDLQLLYSSKETDRSASANPRSSEVAAR
jgi:hypothetical protein